jgi:hypothetical protein
MRVSSWQGAGTLSSEDRVQEQLCCPLSEGHQVRWAGWACGVAHSASSPLDEVIGTGFNFVRILWLEIPLVVTVHGDIPDE